jgi:lipopolysaccharide export system protein LptA
MKKLLLLGSLFFLSGVASEIKAQDNTSNIMILKANRISYFEKDSATIVEGDASISTGKLVVTKADKILFDKSSNKITIHGSCDFTFSGRLIKTPITQNNTATLEYTIGEDTVYLK